DGAGPGALGTAGYEEYVASVEGRRSRGILERHASLEQMHQLDVAVSHRPATIRRRVPRTAHELAVDGTIVAVASARRRRPDQQLRERGIGRLQWRILIDRHHSGHSTGHRWTRNDHHDRGWGCGPLEASPRGKHSAPARRHQDSAALIPYSQCA